MLIRWGQAVQAQREVDKIQNTRGISFAGAYLGYGFHEDGFTSGLKAATSLGGVSLPFVLQPPDRRVTHEWLASVFDILELVRKLIAYVFIGILFK